MSTHHQSRGNLTPSRQSRMNLGGWIDMTASPKRAAAKMAVGHQAREERTTD